jgi:4-diphosphocytidyl-2-C-methyl-D-erythritol kinase
MTNTTWVGHANAKLNLSLKVLGRQADGYHLLRSNIAFLALADNLTIRLLAPTETTDQLQLDGAITADIPDTANNLALRAAVVFRQRFCPTLPPVQIELTKRLPSGAGLGGGSADAAAVIRGLMMLTGVDKAMVDAAPWHDWLGADVPVCLYNQPAVVTGVGQHVEPMALSPELIGASVVLVMPQAKQSTAQLFAKLAQTAGAQAAGAEDDNDLYPVAAALNPSLARLRQALQQQPNCLLSGMTGSGSALFGIFPPLAAQAAYHQLQNHPDAHWLALTRFLE